MPDHNMFKLPEAGMVSFSDPIIQETMTEQIICIPVFCEKKKKKPAMKPQMSSSL